MKIAFDWTDFDEQDTFFWSKSGSRLTNLDFTGSHMIVSARSFIWRGLEGLNPLIRQPISDGRWAFRASLSEDKNDQR